MPDQIATGRRPPSDELRIRPSLRWFLSQTLSMTVNTGICGSLTNGDDCGVRPRHGMVLLLLLPRTSMLARRAGARPVHPILGPISPFEKQLPSARSAAKIITSRKVS